MKPEIVKMQNFLRMTQNRLNDLLNRSDEIIDDLSSIPLHDTTRIYFIGNGSSGEDARIAAFLSVKMLEILPHCVTPYSFTHGLIDSVHPDDIVVAISQTGTSHEVVESLRLARSKKARTIAITATVGSPIAREAEVPLIIEECVENVDYKVTGVLGLLYTLWIVILGLAYHNVRITKDELHANLNEIRANNACYDALAQVSEKWTEEYVETLDACRTLTVLGSADVAETAMELAIKSIEVQGRYAMAVDTEEFLHGICAANPKDNLIVMLVDGRNEAYARKVYESIRSRNQSVLWVGPSAPDNGLTLDLLPTQHYTTAQFFPVVHSIVVTWARLKDYGDVGSEVFADYQRKLKVREE